MAKIFNLSGVKRVRSHDQRFVSYIAEGILYLDDRWRFEWQPALTAGHRPRINIPMLLEQVLDECDIDPQQLDRRLYNVYRTIVGRMTEITGDFPASLEDRRTNPKRFVACFTDWVRHVNGVVENEWKPAWREEKYSSLDVRKISHAFLEANQVQLHQIKGMFGDLHAGAESCLYDLRDWKVFGKDIWWRQVMSGAQK